MKIPRPTLDRVARIARVLIDCVGPEVRPGRPPRSWVRRTIGGGLVVGVLTLAASGAVAQDVTLLSKADPGLFSDTGGGTSSGRASVSADGRYLVFSSTAANLVAGQVDANHTFDVFLHDRVAGTTTLVSHVPGAFGTTGNRGSFGPVISADGAVVAFVSEATNLVAGTDANGTFDVFLYERATGTVTLVSHVPGAPGTTGSRASLGPVLSADGAVVAFTSNATNLVAGTDANGDSPDVFLYERATGTVTLVSHVPGAPGTTGNRTSSNPVISADGAVVAFVSEATNLVAGTDANNTTDVFLYERATGTVTLVSHIPGEPGTSGNGGSGLGRELFLPDLALSADGAVVAFVSAATNLVAGTDANNTIDVFLYERATGTVTLVSHVPGAPGTTGHWGSTNPVLSADGAFVAFESIATNLVAGTDANNTTDVFLYERATGTVTLVSHVPGAPGTTGTGFADSPALSADGGVVVFVSGTKRSPREDLTGDDGTWDIVLYERATGAVTLVSHPLGAPGTRGNAISDFPAISLDGAVVVFLSRATDLVAETDANFSNDVFLHERATSTTTLVSRRDPGLPSLSAAGDSAPDGMSADGRWVVFTSSAVNLVAGQADAPFGQDVFLHDRVTGTTTLVSHALGAPGTPGNHPSSSPVISPDGAFVAFRSNATNLVAGPDANGDSADVFLYERATGTVTLVSHVPGAPETAGNGQSFHPVISADGAFVAFESIATDLVAGTDANGGSDVFLYERATGTVRLVSHVPGAAGTTGNNSSGAHNTVMSADGAFVAFSSNATNLVAGTDANGDFDVFLYERATGTVRLVSRVPGAAGTTGNGVSFGAAMSADGAFVAFHSRASNLVAGTDVNGGLDVFVYERITGTVRLVSHVPGAAGTTGNKDSLVAVMSADGAFVAFQSWATNLVAGTDTNNAVNGIGLDVFLFERATGTVTLVSHIPGVPGDTGNRHSRAPVISADGAFVAFVSQATNLVAGTDANDSGEGEFDDVFLYERATGTVTLVSHVPGAPGTTGHRASGGPVISADGATVVFRSSARDLVPGNFGALGRNVFAYARVADPTAPDTVIDAGPAARTGTSATFVFSGSDDSTPAGSLTFECALDGETFAACASPQSYAGLAEGAHTFHVRAIDGAGTPDPSPATRTWVVDATAPNTTITAGPPAATQSTSARFSFTSEAGATFACELDGGGFTACTSPRTYGGLAVGSHTFTVRATDSAGNTDPTPASVTWSIEPPGRPDLVTTSVSNPPAAVAPGGSFSVTDTVLNQGNADAGTSTTRYYVSLVLGKTPESTLLLGPRAVTSLGTGAASQGTRVVTVPASTAPATYYLLACADDLARVSETDESNNCVVASAQVTVGRPDLVVTELSNPPAEAARGSSFLVTETVTNQGEIGADLSMTRYYFSFDDRQAPGDRLLKGSRAVPALDASASFPATPAPVTVTIPTGIAPGTYFLIACADDQRRVLEGDETNNCRASTTTVVVP